MICPLADLMNMKLNPNSARLQISKHEVVHPSETTRADIYEHYEHPSYKFNKEQDNKAQLIRPNPPSKEAVERAKFVDKTYHWSGSDSVRSRNKRTDS